MVPHPCNSKLRPPSYQCTHAFIEAQTPYTIHLFKVLQQKGKPAIKNPLHPRIPPGRPQRLCTRQILPLRSRVLNMKPRVTPPLLFKEDSGWSAPHSCASIDTICHPSTRRPELRRPRRAARHRDVGEPRAGTVRLNSKCQASHPRKLNAAP